MRGYFVGGVMKAKLPMISRYLLGVIYFGAGLMGLIMPGAPPPDFPEKALAFFGGIAAASYFIPFLKVTETVCGLLLLINRAPALSLVVLAPITINIFLFHILLTPGIQFAVLPIIMVALHLNAACKYWPIYKPLFAKGN